MAVERKAIRSVSRGRARIIQTGIGHASVARAVSEAAETTDIFLLVGFAGAIRHAEDPTPPIKSIIDEQDKARWSPSIIAPGGSPQTLLTLNEPACTVESKLRLAERFPDVLLIDMEASSFARAVEKLSGARWGVVRAVSDGLDETLPDDVSFWLDDRGNTKILGVFRSLLRGRTSFGELSRLSRAIGHASKLLEDAADRMLTHIESDST